MVDAMTGTQEQDSDGESSSASVEKSYICIMNRKQVYKQLWCSGNIGSSHGLAPGSTPGSCIVPGRTFCWVDRSIPNDFQGRDRMIRYHSYRYVSLLWAYECKLSS